MGAAYFYYYFELTQFDKPIMYSEQFTTQYCTVYSMSIYRD